MWTLSNKRTWSHRSNAHSACPYPSESYLDNIALWPNHCSFPLSFCLDAWYSPRELSLLTFYLDIDYELRKPPEGWFPGLLRGLAWQIHPTNHGATTWATNSTLLKFIIFLHRNIWNDSTSFFFGWRKHTMTKVQITRGLHTLSHTGFGPLQSSRHWRTLTISSSSSSLWRSKNSSSWWN